jgi:hypothetical protein
VLYCRHSGATWRYGGSPLLQNGSYFVQSVYLIPNPFQKIKVPLRTVDGSDVPRDDLLVSVFEDLMVKALAKEAKEAKEAIRTSNTKVQRKTESLGEGAPAPVIVFA